MVKRWIVLLAGLGLSSLALAAPVAGEDYRVLETPVDTQVDAGKVEVVEAFWYGCPHCYDLEEPLNAWVDGLAEDVVFRPLPATLGDVWTRHAKAFYTAEQLGILDDVHDDFFDAIHEDGRRLTEPQAIAEFFSDYGVSEEEALKALDSFGVKSRINQAHAKIRAYKLMGVPALIVDGRYVVTPDSAGSLEAMPEVAGALIEKARGEQQHAQSQGE
jgi:thiol:disulfide interchange protein DsbA